MPLFDNWPYVDLSKLNLDFVLTKINEIEQVKAEIDAKLEELDRYTTAFNELSQKYEQLENDFNLLRSDVDNQISDGLNTINSRVNELEGRLNSQYASFTANVNSTIQALQRQVSDLDSELRQAIDSLQDTITLFNPLTGETNTLQQIIYYLASLHMGDALTAAEYDALELTASAYDAYQLTAYQYDSEGRTLLS